MPHPPITTLALYVKNMPKIAEFYAKHFGFKVAWNEAGDKATLTPANGGCALVLLQASKGHRVGQSCVKIVFNVADLTKFKAKQAKLGLKFGVTHRGPNYEFSNARDPAKNLIQISNAFLTRSS